MSRKTPLKLESFLPYRLSLLSNTVSSTIAANYRDKFGISMPEWRVMAVLGEYPGISADEICQRTQIEKSVISRSVTKVLERHLVVREFDNNDRRRSILALSETGKSVYDEIVPYASAYEKSLLSTLGKKERELMDVILSKLQRQAETLQED